MLGRITVNRGELKVKDLEIYQAFYCGICQDIKKRSGQLSRLTLNYDMTFLAILLTALYGGHTEAERLRCLLHPATRKVCIRNDYTRYTADLCVILTYHNLMDDVLDEGSRKSMVFADLLRPAYKKCAREHPRQANAVIRYVKDLHKVEKSGSDNLDLAAGLTGKAFAELFRIHDTDIWNRELNAIGFYLGKFIYLADAREDVEEDRKKGNYNPFLPQADESGFDTKAKEILTMMVSAAAAAFERLPIVDYADILRNILYSGVWNESIKKKNMGDKHAGPI